MLSPEEIAAREFLVSLRGYDRDEVHAFLARVADDLRTARARAEELDGELQQLRAERAQARPIAAPAPGTPEQTSAMFAAIGQETQRILEAAQEAGAQIQRKARHDAELQLESARMQSVKLIADGERRREAAERIVERLESERAAISADLREVGRMIAQTLRTLAPGERGPTPAPAAADAQPPPPAVADPQEPSPPPEPVPAAVDPQEPPRPPEPVAAGIDRQEAPPEPAPAAVDPGELPPAPAQAGVAPQPPAPGPAHAAPQPPVPAPGDATRQSPAGTPAPDLATEAVRLRSQALSPLHPQLVRRVKRELQEVQNIALDRVRRARGQGSAESFLPDPDEARSPGAGSGDYLEQAWHAGVAAAAALAGRDLGAAPEPPVLQDVLTADAADRVRSGLATTLRRGLSAEESEQALSDRIGAVFGELKGPSADDLAASHLVRAYELGMLSAWRTGGVAARRWVLGREPRCPEARCRHNDHGGALALSEPFPSGHEVPPVHLGCTCATVPVMEPPG